MIWLNTSTHCQLNPHSFGCTLGDAGMSLAYFSLDSFLDKISSKSWAIQPGANPSSQHNMHTRSPQFAHTSAAGGRKVASHRPSSPPVGFPAPRSSPLASEPLLQDPQLPLKDPLPPTTLAAPH
eukprot:321996-Amphidinium_carterae.1